MAKLTLLHGPNFSGRTELLRRTVDHECNEQERAVVHIGPDPFMSFSGLAASVANEFELTLSTSWRQIVADLGIEYLTQRNLATLSGGEEALCAIGVGLALKTRVVAIDSAMEQLDRQFRERVLQVLSRSDAEQILIADNRFSEWEVPASIECNHQYLEPPKGPQSLIRRRINLQKLDDVPNEIEISGVRHRYPRGDWVLNGTSMKLKAGSILSLSGPNGAGKSTLAKVLVGALQPQEGRLAIRHRSKLTTDEPLGRPTLLERLAGKGRRSLWDRPGSIFSYHFQNPDSQLFQCTVLQELATSANRPGRTFEDAQSIVEAIVEAFGLQAILTSHPQDLPFVMRKRVALAATFACGTPWVILDEPTIGQDEDTVSSITDLIKASAQQGVGFIIISHSMRFLHNVGAQTLFLRDGVVHC